MSGQGISKVALDLPVKIRLLVFVDKHSLMVHSS